MKFTLFLFLFSTFNTFSQDFIEITTSDDNLSDITTQTLGTQISNGNIHFFNKSYTIIPSNGGPNGDAPMGKRFITICVEVVQGFKEVKRKLEVIESLSQRASYNISIYKKNNCFL